MSTDIPLKLSPCPFCGGTKLYIRGEGSHHERIKCDTCFADWRIEYATERAIDRATGAAGGECETEAE